MVVHRSLLAFVLVLGCGRWELELVRSTADGGDASVDAGVSGSLCDGLVQDTAPHPMTALAQPAVGAAVIDPEFHTTIRRITAASSAIVPLQPATGAWNADESALLLYEIGTGYRLYDGRSYAFLRTLDIAPADVEQVYWDASDPDVFYFPSSRSLYRYRVASAAQEIVHTFEFCTDDLIATSQGGMSWDTSVIGLRCGDQVFFYRRSDDAVGMHASSTDVPPQTTASGSGGVWNSVVVDFDVMPLRTLDLAPGGNAATGRGADGHDMFYAVAFSAGAASPVGSLLAFDLSDGSWRVSIGEATGFPYPGQTTDISATAYARPGWVFVSSVGDTTGQEVLGSEILLADTSPGGVVCRIAHHRSLGRDSAQGGWGTPAVVASPSGTRAIFASDWGGAATVDTYVVELPGYHP